MRAALQIAILLLKFFAVCSAGVSFANGFPARPVTIVVGNEPGGPTDFVARSVAQGLSALWNQPVVVENRSGAGGIIAAQMVARAPADGYTLLLGGITNLVAAPAMDPRLQYDPVRDFQPIGRVAVVPFVLAVRAGLDVTSAQALLARIRASPGRLAFGTVGPASAGEFVARTLSAQAGADFLVVPYKGSATMLGDLLAGRIDMTVTDLTILAPHAARGSVTLLAVVGSRRTSAAPDLPTLAEQGMGHMTVDPWYGLLAPAGTPDEVLEKVRSGLQRVARLAEFQNRLAQRNYVSMQDTPAEFGTALGADVDRWRKALQDAVR